MPPTPPTIQNSLFSPVTAALAPTNTTSSKKLPGNSYLSLHHSKLARNSNCSVPNLNATGGTTTTTATTQFQPRTSSLGSLNAQPKLAEQQFFIQRTPIGNKGGGGGGTLTGSSGSGGSHAVREEGGDEYIVMTSSVSTIRDRGRHSADVYPCGSSGGEGSNSMSKTWPRGTTVPPINPKSSPTINADSVGIAGGKYLL